MDWLTEIWRRVQPAAVRADLSGQFLLVAAGIALILVAVGPLWRIVRLGVTLVHELGHAFVGVLGGRRFTGFVLQADMSGHAVTAGKPRGTALVLSTWAGYPAPALLSVGLLAAAGRGWAAPVVTAAAILVLVAIPRIRSVLTGLVVFVTLAGLAALWWWRDDRLQTIVLVTAAFVLLVGAWRHILAVSRARGSVTDPSLLAGLTRIPAAIWVTTFWLVAAGCTYVGLWLLGVTEPLLRSLRG